MGIKRCILILCIILLLLPGCGRQRDSTGSGQGDPAAEKALMYVDETWDAGITPGYVPQTASFLLAENNLYFLDRTGGFCRSVYKVSLQEPQARRSWFCNWNRVLLKPWPWMKSRSLY